jgi:putative membrane protein
VGIGAAAGVTLFSSLVDFLLKNYSFPTMLFFIGLIAGIIPHIFREVKEKGRVFALREILLVAVPFVLLILLSLVKKEAPVTNEVTINNITVPYMIFILAAGILAAAALVIPGISGSFILLLLGLYHLITASLASVRVLLADITNTGLMLDICKVLGPFGVGIIIGGLSMARLIEKLLKNHRKPLYSVILGLLAGSIIALFRDPLVYASGISVTIVSIGIAAFLLGCVLSFIAGKKRL